LLRAFDIAHVLASAVACFVPVLIFQGSGRDLSSWGVILLCTLAAAVGAAIAGVACRWWPGLAAPGWQLWLAAWLFNPVVIVGVIYIASQYECLLGQTRGWKCMGLALAVLASPLTLVGPTVAIIAHVIARRTGSVAG